MVDCAETARLLLASARKHLVAARAAALAQDTERLGFAAHSLRGTALTLGAQRLAELAGTLESLPPRTRLARARGLVRSLAQELERIAGQLG
jgi:HPt (histidine-containing phosphotransfer) domain-containing protein